jgi:peptidoglycan/xylan/chitin deacetylase (PgdA/CDA1 family)
MVVIYSLIQKGRELKLFFTKSIGRVLMFHQVNDEKYWKYKDISITREHFKKLIETLSANDFIFSSINDIYEKKQLTDKSIILTFDDGFACVYEFVAKYLFDRRIPFTCFITVNFLNRPIYLTSEQLIDLSTNNLCTIGAHSVSHLNLRMQKDLISKNEILNSKKLIEDKIIRSVDYFSFPYGSIYAVSLREIKFVRESGYKLAFSSVNGCLSRHLLEERYFLPRINANEDYYNKIIKC